MLERLLTIAPAVPVWAQAPFQLGQGLSEGFEQSASRPATGSVPKRLSGVVSHWISFSVDKERSGKHGPGIPWARPGPRPLS